MIWAIAKFFIAAYFVLQGVAAVLAAVVLVFLLVAIAITAIPTGGKK